MLRFKHYVGAELPNGEYGRSDLNCSKCYEMKAEAGLVPLCEGAGCPIQDLASDPVINRMIHEFTSRRLLFEISNSEMVYNKLCEDFGFYDDYGFHYQCEATYLEWRHQARQKKKQKFGKI